MTAASIEFRGATKRYRGASHDAVSDLWLRVEPGEICVLVGPSGGGKTTAMKMVNRLVELDAGDVLVDGRSVRDLDATELRRRVGYVIQQVGLFPHMTVGGNVAVVPRLLGWPRTRVAGRVDELLELMGLPAADFRDRYPGQLSGGQRQRVGIARALAGDPGVLLMDEPFGALDPITRSRLQDEFLKLQDAVRKTVLFVTHDVDEAVRLGDRMAILREGGELVQVDRPDTILAEPADEFVARLVGADRGLKRLALRRLADVELEPASLAAADDPRIDAATTLRDAVSVMLSEGAIRCAVTNGSGPAGSLSLDRIAELLAD
ncbi:MAG TPA: ABC transporter ATP-binding protein [Gaiellaceae bacterium]|nr:ABC transporter ATP-binding protein [Gaiellaceae bacterium]